MNRREFVAGSLALAVAARAVPAWAQSGPLTRIVFPFAAGGSGDMLCRQLAEYLPAALDRKFIVENRTGGDGLIGIRAVKGAAPDSTTVLMTTGPTMFLLPMVENEPSYDSAKDFVPVSQLARFEFVVVVSPSIGVTDFKQLVAWIKANPAKASYGVPSSGTIPHFTGFQLEKTLGLSMTRVPYRGSAPIISDLLAGHLPLAVTTLSDTITQHRAGGIRIVAVSGPVRSPFLSDVPTLKESGVDLVADGWYGMWLPAGSSPEFAKKLSAAAAEVLARPDVKEKLNAVTLIPVGSTPEQLTKALAADTAFWQPIVKATGYKIAN
ncbi:Bug family tripartite tricarboxylate transporter substrate binding protein [Bradyrhizobium sp.]|uniref:Bug family tripartite tricarboxylate transporter substrate binding protein n=1 Tax=Bradyrhizobium sp. TaxID=376 RepID=UPI001D23CB0A|nr:Bug family tripartite tricarboxylate transporter substrate binding protein [Bradyrhizobium sp.]MBI5322925.1 Bug family tripartite tricarboxylate transporter substrate binding protein [Bradyrhizobium sp.]